MKEFDLFLPNNFNVRVYKAVVKGVKAKRLARFHGRDLEHNSPLHSKAPMTESFHLFYGSVGHWLTEATIKKTM